MVLAIVDAMVNEAAVQHLTRTSKAPLRYLSDTFPGSLYDKLEAKKKKLSCSPKALPDSITLSHVLRGSCQTLCSA